MRWYLKVHLVEEYGIKNFDLKFLETEFPIEVLNNDLHTQFQRLIKMYHLYSEYEEVDLEEVDLETNKNFSELKGINGKKYIWPRILKVCR